MPGFFLPSLERREGIQHGWGLGQSVLALETPELQNESVLYQPFSSQQSSSFCLYTSGDGKLSFYQDRWSPVKAPTPLLLQHQLLVPALLSEFREESPSLTPQNTWETPVGLMVATMATIPCSGSLFLCMKQPPWFLKYFSITSPSHLPSKSYSDFFSPLRSEGLVQLLLVINTSVFHYHSWKILILIMFVKMTCSNEFGDCWTKEMKTGSFAAGLIRAFIC